MATAVGLAAVSTPILAGAAGFVLVNQTGSALADVAARRTGTSEWRPLGAAVSDGARTSVTFSDPDCAFDLKARVAGDGEATWRAVNLCEVSSVTLRRDSAGSTWVDYD